MKLSLTVDFTVDMELKKLHMGTMSYSVDTMDEISTHLDTAYSQPCKNACPNNLWWLHEAMANRILTG
jgi:hypothetical protein